VCVCVFWVVVATGCVTVAAARHTRALGALLAVSQCYVWGFARCCVSVSRDRSLVRSFARSLVVHLDACPTSQDGTDAQQAAVPAQASYTPPNRV
jgi:hypothetical protein